MEETFRKRAEDSEAFGKSQNKDDGIDHSNTSKNRLPPHFAESLPTGLILAGGVNADDHEETFASLAKFLAKSDFHCALLQSKDVKTRKSGFGGGIGGGGMNSSSGGSTTFASSAASRGILGDCVSLVARQLESRNAALGRGFGGGIFESSGAPSSARWCWEFDANNSSSESWSENS